MCRLKLEIKLKTMSGAKMNFNDESLEWLSVDYDSLVCTKDDDVFAFYDEIQMIYDLAWSDKEAFCHNAYDLLANVLKSWTKAELPECCMNPEIVINKKQYYILRSLWDIMWLIKKQQNIDKSTLLLFAVRQLFVLLQSLT